MEMVSNAQPLSAILILIFFSMILPAIVMIVDQFLYVDEVEKEEREHGKLTPGH